MTEGLLWWCILLIMGIVACIRLWRLCLGFDRWQCVLEEAASSAIGAESAGAVVGTFFFCLELLNFRLVSLLISCQISMTHKRYLSSALRWPSLIATKSRGMVEKLMEERYVLTLSIPYSPWWMWWSQLVALWQSSPNSASNLLLKVCIY